MFGNGWTIDVIAHIFNQIPNIDQYKEPQLENNNSNTPEEEKDLAQTPPEFVKALEKYLRISFRLDVCALKRTAKCGEYYSLAERSEDAFKLPWSPTANFCNPPYSDIKPWVLKAAKEAMKGCSLTALLVPDKPETDYTRNARALADTVIHMPYRMKFLRPDGSGFVDKDGKPQGPKFACCVYIFTPWGLNQNIRDTYVDFRKL